MKEDQVTKDSEPDSTRTIAGYGMTVLVIAGLIVLGIAAAVVFVLFMFGSWIGGQ